MQVGDQLDRGDHELEILYFLERLQREAARAGGALHVLNGNHEVGQALQGLCACWQAGRPRCFGCKGLQLNREVKPAGGCCACRLAGRAACGALGRAEEHHRHLWQEACDIQKLYWLQTSCGLSSTMSVLSRGDTCKFVVHV